MVVNIYLRSLKTNISSSITVAKFFNSCIGLWSNYIVSIRISTASTLKNQVLLISGDIRTNLGPKKSSTIKFCHWNLNSLAVHDFLKVPLLGASITTPIFNILCLSCKLSISSFLLFLHWSDYLICARNSMSIVLLFQIMGGWNRWGDDWFITGCGRGQRVGIIL